MRGSIGLLRVVMFGGLDSMSTDQNISVGSKSQSFEMLEQPARRNRGERRVSFHPGIVKDVDDVTSLQRSQADEAIALSIEGVIDKKFSDLSQTKSKPGNIPLNNSIIEVEHEKDDEEGSFDNATFKLDELSHSDCLIYAFGKKGKNIGEFEDAKHITCLPRGRIIITDLVNSRLQICSELSRTITLFSPQEINLPWATALTKETFIAVTLCKDRCIKVLNLDGDVINAFGHDYLVNPTGLATDKNGNFIVCDSVTSKVSMFDNKGTFIRFLGNPDNKEECFRKPYYACVSITDEIIISDTGSHKVKLFDSEGKFVKSFGSFGKRNNQFKSPYGVTTNKCGDIFVADHYNSRVSLFTRDGIFVRHIVTSEHGLVHPQGLTINEDLHLFISHGHLKASEILVFKLTNNMEYLSSDHISYV